MIIQCENCSRKFVVRDEDIPKKGRMVQCGYCSTTWHQKPSSIPEKKLKQKKIKKLTDEIEESPSVDSIEASDGKTYKFLGSQWAELLPSGKTGLFARKKISQELDEITGRKEKKVIKKRQKKLEEVDPSQSINAERKSTNARIEKEGLGLLGYIFLIIIISFSTVGILKTFESDLLNYFPEMEFIYIILDEQLVYVSETVKNMIVIINDLLNSY